MKDSKRNHVRQPADLDVDVDEDMDSCRKTDMKDPSYEEGNTEKY